MQLPSYASSSGNDSQFQVGGRFYLHVSCGDFIITDRAPPSPRFGSVSIRGSENSIPCCFAQRPRIGVQWMHEQSQPYSSAFRKTVVSLASACEMMKTVEARITVTAGVALLTLAILFSFFPRLLVYPARPPSWLGSAARCSIAAISYTGPSERRRNNRDQIENPGVSLTARSSQCEHGRIDLKGWLRERGFRRDVFLQRIRTPRSPTIST